MNIVNREVKVFVRNGNWIVSILFAVIMIFSVGLAISGDFHQAQIGIACNNQFQVAPLVHYIQNDSRFQFQMVNTHQILYGIKADSLRAGVSVDFLSVQEVNITIYIDATDNTIEQQLSYLLTSIVYQSFGQYGTGLHVTDQDLNGKKDTLAYIVPGVLAISILGGGLFGASESILQEKDKKTVENVILTGFSPMRFVIEKIFSLMLSTTIISVISLIMVFYFTGLPDINGLFTLVIAIGLGEFLFISLGVGISSIIPNADVATPIMALVQFPFLFISGVFFSVYQMNPLIIPIAQLNPTSFLIDIFKSATLKGASISQLAQPLMALLGLSIGCFVITNLLMYRAIRKIQT